MDPISIQLAEALGWSNINDYNIGFRDDIYRFIPDYAHDDSAIDAEVRKLTGEQQSQYSCNLATILVRAQSADPIYLTYIPHFSLLTATAAEKCRALIETLKEKK